jgi:hypothetical protein
MNYEVRALRAKQFRLNKSGGRYLEVQSLLNSKKTRIKSNRAFFFGSISRSACELVGAKESQDHLSR